MPFMQSLSMPHEPLFKKNSVIWSKVALHQKLLCTVLSWDDLIIAYCFVIDQNVATALQQHFCMSPPQSSSCMWNVSLGMYIPWFEKSYLGVIWLLLCNSSEWCNCIATRFCACHHSSVFIECGVFHWEHIDSILPKGPYPPCLRMADRALLAGYPRYIPLFDLN